MEINAERFNEVLNSHGMTPRSASIRIGSSPSTLSNSIRLGRISSTTLSRLHLIGITEEEIKSINDLNYYKKDEKEETSSNTVQIINVSEQEMKEYMIYLKTIQELMYANNSILKQILDILNE